MKHYLCYIMILIASTCVVGCQDDKEELMPTVVEKPIWELDLKEDDPEPKWEEEVPASGVFQFSMTGTIRLSEFLEAYADDSDEISAFIGNECRGMVRSQVYEGERLFFLYIRGNASETQKVTLKYYSAKNKKLYVCNELFEFEQNGSYGKLSEPIVPPFEEAGKYPEVMTVTVALNVQLPFEPRFSDQLAAIVGDECRGVGSPLEVDGKQLFQFDIRGKKGEAAPVYFLYYSQQASGIYKADETFLFTNKGVLGTKENPFILSWQPVINQ